MNILVSILTFCIVLFLYLHIFFHYKTSNDLEIYEIDLPSKNKLEEICDLRQPVVFSFANESILEGCSKNNLIKNYEAFDLKIRNKNNPNVDYEVYVPLALGNVIKLLDNDKDEKYFTERNQDFLEETGVIKYFRYNDAFLRPYMVSNCNYDIMLGSNNTKTPFKYELNYRNYLMVTEGSIDIKMSPPHSAKYLYGIKDYDNFEFLSPVNPWNVQDEYKPDFNKTKCLEFTLNKGQIIQIPPFWWYTMRFKEDSFIASFKYRTYMNTVAISPYIFMSMLQGQNVKRKVVKKMELDDSPKENSNNIIQTDTTNIEDITPEN